VDAATTLRVVEKGLNYFWFKARSAFNELNSPASGRGLRRVNFYPTSESGHSRERQASLLH